MKRILLIAAMLLPVASAMAGVTITADVNTTSHDHDGVKHKTVTIGYASDVDVRAFALDITVDNGMRIGKDPPVDFLRGESIAPNKGYGIFPGRFRDYINPTTPDWGNANYMPVTPEDAPGAEDTGLGWPRMVVELGTLYSGDANKPNLSGTLFTFDVNSNGITDCNLRIALEPLRGGVVGNDGNPLSTNLPTSTKVTFDCTVPNVVDQPEATATAAITGAGFTLGTRTTACHSTIIAGNVISTNPAGGSSAPCGSAVDYVVSIGTVPAVPGSITVPASDADGAYTISWTSATGATSYVLESSAPASGTTVYPLWVPIYSGTALSYSEKVGGGTWSYRVKAVNACGESDYRTGSTNCVVANSLKSTATGYAAWVNYRYPQCWAFRRHCRGDIDGKKKIVGGHVSGDDLTIFKAVYGRTVAEIAATPCTTFTVTGRICGFCADLDHKSKIVGGRVSGDDLAIFKTYYGQADAVVTCCDTVAPANDCVLAATDQFSFWTN